MTTTLNSLCGKNMRKVLVVSTNDQLNKIITLDGSERITIASMHVCFTLVHYDKGQQFSKQLWSTPKKITTLKHNEKNKFTTQ